MKKTIILSILIIMIISLTIKSEDLIIPKDSLRFRVIANSNESTDQQIKLDVKNNLEQEIIGYIGDATTTTAAIQNLTKNMNLINNNIEDTLLKNNVNYTYSTNLGTNYFPYKEYKGVIYEKGDYESLVVTLGEGIGDNWWCVLFPPLCLIEAEEQETDEVEYKFFISEIIDKYMK